MLISSSASFLHRSTRRECAGCRIRRAQLTLSRCSAVVAVWVMYELAVRPEYIPAIRDELAAIAEPQADGSHHLSYESLRNAVYLDSFIREVMRLKGDTLGVCRQTVQDTPMGDYVIPKGM